VRVVLRVVLRVVRVVRVVRRVVLRVVSIVSVCGVSLRFAVLSWGLFFDVSTMRGLSLSGPVLHCQWCAGVLSYLWGRANPNGAVHYSSLCDFRLSAAGPSRYEFSGPGYGPNDRRVAKSRL
jgi:hypothetical protein